MTRQDMKSTATAKIFRNGNSQAVRIPKQFRLLGNEVSIHREGACVILKPMQNNWEDFFFEKTVVDDDFLRLRKDTLPQQRELF